MWGTRRISVSENERARSGGNWASVWGVVLVVLSWLGRAIAWPFVNGYYAARDHVRERGMEGFLIWTGLALMTTVSILTTGFSTQGSIFSMSSVEEAKTFGESVGIFVKHNMAPWLFAIGLGLFLAAMKIGLVRFQGGRMAFFAGCFAVLIMAFPSILFNYDVIFQATNESFLVAEEKSRVFNSYSGYTGEARAIGEKQLEEFAVTAARELQSFEVTMQQKATELRHALPVALEALRVKQAAEVIAIEKERDARRLELEGMRDARIAGIEQQRDARVPALRKHLAARRIETSQELAKLRAQLESETKGLVGDKLSGVAGKGTRARAIEAQLAAADAQVDAEIKAKEQALAEEERKYELEIAAVRKDWDERLPKSVEVFQKRIDDLTARHQADQKALQDEMGANAQAEQDALKQVQADRRKQFEDDQRVAKERIEGYLRIVANVESRLSELSLCMTLSCVIRQDAIVSTLVLPLHPLVGKDLKKTASLPPMFASMNLLWQYWESVLDDGVEVPRQVSGVVLSCIIALTIDLADFAALMVFRPVSMLHRRREEDEQGQAQS